MIITKKEVKKAKKILRYRHDNEIFYKFDKYLKLTTVKVMELIPTEDIEGGIKYRVKYKHGLNLLNPLSWVYIMFIIIYSSFETIREIISELKLDSYSDHIKIKND